MIEYTLFLILVFIATVITGVLGFGAAVILIPLSSFFLEVKKSIAIITLYLISINISQIYHFWKNINWKLVGYILLGAIPAVTLGSFLMVISPSRIIKQILGIMVLGQD